MSFQLWGRTFLDSFHPQTDPNRGNIGADGDSEDEDEDEALPRPHIRVLPRTRISIRRNPAGMGPGQGTLQRCVFLNSL